MDLTGEQFRISAGRYEAVVTELGGGLRELSFEGTPLILGHDADELPPAASGQLLIPWPNRIDRGRYAFAGRTHRLPVNEPEHDTAIHGLVRWAPWTVIEHAPDRLRLAHRLLGRPGYPFRLDLSVEYALDDGGLTVRHRARNSGGRPAPYGYGAHPYLTLGRPIDECELAVPAERYLEVDERALPVGAPREVAGTPLDFREARPLGDTSINNAYTGLRRDADGVVRVRLGAVTLWADEAHPWLEIYTADESPGGLRRAGLGVEPMTCPPNAFVTGVDLITLRPDEEFSGTWGIACGGASLGRNRQ
jgi:aldose 1-epimerase